jgi:hypothetical protein
METIIKNSKSTLVKSDYDFANDFVNQLVKDHREKLSELVLKYKGTDLSLASNKMLGEALKTLMKEQNAGFINELSEYIVSTKNKSGIKSMPETRISELKTTFNSSGSCSGAVWTLGADKYKEAIAYLKSKGYSEDEADDLISCKGENAEELKDWKSGKKPFDWNLAMETTGKVAQSIFLLGSILGKKEDQAPTLTDSDQGAKKSKSNLTRNILIAVLIIAVLGTTAYFVFRKKS